MTRRFRKKPVEVEAILYKQVDIPNPELVEFLKGTIYYTTTSGLVIKTFTGDRLVRPGDWIIKKLDKTFSICKPDIFELTYDEIIDSES